MADNLSTDYYQPPLIQYGGSFLERHVGQIITRPDLALVELIANAWDAGADLVKISWLQGANNLIEFSDNGTGMTADEFRLRWATLYYDRHELQGDSVVFPSGNQRSNRKAFGRNGIGRHAMFCFAPSYQVASCRNGQQITCTVSRTANPFEISSVIVAPVDASQHGTRLCASAQLLALSEASVREVLATKFIADPGFSIVVNGQEVQLQSQAILEENQRAIEIEGIGVVLISIVDTGSRSRTSLPHGVAWWVNRRLVGNVEWKTLSGVPYADGRTTEARRYTFVVQADFLADEVKPDWSGFNLESAFVQRTAELVEEYIAQQITSLFREERRRRKSDAMRVNRELISGLPQSSQKRVGIFIDQLQVRIPLVQDKVLSDTVAVFAKMEEAQSGYALLAKLAQLDPADIDMLNSILTEWTVSQASLVLDEIGKRLRLIESLQEIIDAGKADELHELQPLFERGLWMFGPEFESIEYTSNATLVTVIRNLFKNQVAQVNQPRNRPDFVVLPDASIGLYSCDAYGADNEVNGIDKVLVIELKRGDFAITVNEMRQAEDYIANMRLSSAISNQTKVIAYVLGARLDERTRMAPITTVGETQVYGATFGTIVQRAHARTFKLAEKIKQLAPEIEFDVVEIMNEQDLQPSLIG